MMRACAHKVALVMLAMAIVLGAAGCFPSRREVFGEIRRARAGSYARWRDQVGEDDTLPSLQGDLAVRAAIELALEHNPDFQRVLLERRKASGQLLTAYAEGLPTVDLSADYARFDQVSTVDLGFASYQIGDRDNYSYQVTVTQPLFKGGAVGAAVKGAKYYQFLNDEVVREAVQDVISQTALAYYDVRLAEELLQVQVEALEFAKANLADVTTRQKAGVAIPFDLLRARVEVSNVEADMIAQRNGLNRAWTALFRMMGVSQRSQVRLSDELVYTPLRVEFEHAVKLAMLNRPVLYRNELQTLVQQAALKIAQADYLPNLEAWYWHKWARPDPQESSNNVWGGQWQLGLRLRWTLFDGLRREGTIIQRRAELDQSLLQLASTEQAVLEEVRNGIFDLSDAEELVKSQQLNLQRATEALRLVKVGAREGVNTQLEVLDARSALTRARGLYHKALYAHVTARIKLQRTLGMLGPGPGAQGPPKRAPEPGAVEGFVDRTEAPAPAEAGEDERGEEGGEGAQAQPEPSDAPAPGGPDAAEE